MTLRWGLVVTVGLVGALALTMAARAARVTPSRGARASVARAAAARDTVGRVVRTDAEWRRLLSPETYHVLRQSGTELAFTGATWDNHASGSYRCAGCGLLLFDSDTKYDSGTGWPSFWAPIERSHVRLVPVGSLGMEYSEVRCARCDGHLGHVFDDGPEPTHLRYCMNSAALTFQPAR